MCIHCGLKAFAGGQLKPCSNAPQGQFDKYYDYYFNSSIRETATAAAFLDAVIQFPFFFPPRTQPQLEPMSWAKSETIIMYICMYV